VNNSQVIYKLRSNKNCSFYVSSHAEYWNEVEKDSGTLGLSVLSLRKIHVGIIKNFGKSFMAMTLGCN